MDKLFHPILYQAGDDHLSMMVLTHWGRVTHISVGKLTIIGSDNGLSPGRRQAIIWTNAGILLIRPLGTNFSEILIGVQTFSFKKMHLKMSSAKWRPFCPGLNVLKLIHVSKRGPRLGLCDSLCTKLWWLYTGRAGIWKVEWSVVILQYNVACYSIHHKMKQIRLWTHKIHP